jgi:hypothetical protein
MPQECPDATEKQRPILEELRSGRKQLSYLKKQLVLDKDLMAPETLRNNLVNLEKMGCVKRIELYHPYRVYYELRKNRQDSRLENTKKIKDHAQLFSLGKRETTFLIVDGEGENTYTRNSIVCHLDERKISLPPDVREIYDKIENRQWMLKEKEGRSEYWNGPLYALSNYSIERTIPTERLAIRLVLKKTNYFTYKATVYNMDSKISKELGKETLRKRYLEYHDSSIPIEFLANGVGVGIMVLSKDDKLFISRRAKSVGIMADELDLSVAEGIHPEKDFNTVTRSPDPYNAALRGIKEELGMELGESDIQFMGFGVDLKAYQWNLLAIARSPETAKQILNNRTRGADGKWETRYFMTVDAEPRKVFNYLKRQKNWTTPTGWVAIYLALVNIWGKKHVDDIAKEIFEKV